MVDLAARKPLLVNAKPVPAALVDVDGRLDDADTAGILATKDVDDASEGLLPYLAWEVGVDVWRPTWTADVKRAVIKASPVVKRHKGTRFAVAQALAAFGIRSELVEWWQAAPKGQPYTFTITAYVTARVSNDTAPLLSSDLIADVYASVLAAKRHSTAFTLRVAASFPTSVGVAPVAAARARLGLTMHPAPVSEQFESGVGAAPVALARSRIGLAFQPEAVSEDFPASAGLAAVAAARVRVSALLIASA